MTFSIPRLLQSASLVLAVFGVQASAQTSAAFLPDAPSYSSSLQEPQQPQIPQNETEEQRKARERKIAEEQVKQEEKQRFGGIIPQFNVQMGGPFVPLTPKQKFSLSFHTIIDPYTIGLAVLVGGGLGELEDSYTGYGHGPAGLFKRIGASYADNVDGNLIGNAVLPVLFHQDPRYFRKGTGPLKARIIYSALSTFICKGDNGKKQFNFSNVAGNFISGGISNLYYPADQRGAGLTIENGAVVTLEGMVGAQLLEFSPDVTMYMQRRHQRKLAQKAAAAAAKNSTVPPPAQP